MRWCNYYCCCYGLDMENGEVGDMKELGVTESYKLKRQVVLSASEAAEMILRYVSWCAWRMFSCLIDCTLCRVDDILRATPRKREAV